MSAGRNAIKATQLLLSSGGPNLVIDGVWGPRTEAALAGATGSVKAAANAAVKVAEEQGFRKQPPAVARDRGAVGVWATRAEALKWIDNASAVTGTPKEWLLYMLDHEPTKRSGPQGIEYRVDSVSPSGLYKGLMQVGADAWTDASRAKGFGYLGSFDKNWSDPALNVLAAAVFAQVNMGYARNIYDYDGPFTKELIYAMHNQGHTFISSVKSGGTGRYFNGQSDRAKQSLITAANFVRKTIS